MLHNIMLHYLTAHKNAAKRYTTKISFTFGWEKKEEKYDKKEKCSTLLLKYLTPDRI